MTLTNLRKKDTRTTSINYRVPLWHRCVPGKREPLQGTSRPAFVGLADLQDPPHKWHGLMTIHTTYSQARASLAHLLDAVVDDREIVIIQRKSGKRAALIDADELESLLETAHLLSSPKNAERLLSALERSLKGELQRMTPSELRSEVGLDQGKP